MRLSTLKAVSIWIGLQIVICAATASAQIIPGGVFYKVVRCNESPSDFLS